MNYMFRLEVEKAAKDEAHYQSKREEMFERLLSDLPDSQKAVARKQLETRLSRWFENDRTGAGNRLEAIKYFEYEMKAIQQVGLPY